jgi:predicted DNA-binding antitoxin AbrB/MazE fold protein
MKGMDHQVTAIYENGVLRPLEPLALPEQTTVELSIHRIALPVDLATHRRRVRAMLKEGGLTRTEPISGEVRPGLSPERRAELAELLARGKPLSEIIIDERV